MPITNGANAGKSLIIIGSGTIQILRSYNQRIRVYGPNLELLLSATGRT